MYSFTNEANELLIAKSPTWLSTLGVSNTTVPLAIADSNVFGFTITGGGGGVPLSPRFPTTIVNVCVVERLPPSVAVTVNVYVPSGSLPFILPASLIESPAGKPLTL